MSTFPEQFTIAENGQSLRLDVVLFNYFIDSAQEKDKGIRSFSRSYCCRIIREGLVSVNKTPVKKCSYKVSSGDQIELTMPEILPLDLEPRDLHIHILYEDNALAVIEKPAGLTVHPGNGVRDATLVEGLLFAMDSLSSINGVERPGIVHRLDKETQGLMLIAKTDFAHQSLSTMFQNREIKKRYRAIVWGSFSWSFLSKEAWIGRDPSNRIKMKVEDQKIRDSYKKIITNFSLIRKIQHPLGESSLVEIDLLTGRTHQIRTQLQALGFPIVGDTLYGRKKRSCTTEMLLQSFALNFSHPLSGEKMNFVLKKPVSFLEFLQKDHSSDSLSDKE